MRRIRREQSNMLNTFPVDFVSARNFSATIRQNGPTKGLSDERWRNTICSRGGADVINSRTAVGDQEWSDSTRTQPTARVTQEFDLLSIGHPGAAGLSASQQQNPSLYVWPQAVLACQHGTQRSRAAGKCRRFLAVAHAAITVDGTHG